jgi:putative restriction endonuclease
VNTNSNKRNWTREELLLAINLYCKIPFGKIHNKNPEIIELAKLIDRTPSSVSYKLANFASLDDTIDRKGATHFSKLDKEIWDEFQSNWEELIVESELLKTQRLYNDEEQADSLPQGRETIRQVKTRVNQNFFREAVLSNYDFKCCVTGININPLLVASHIIPWSINEKERLNPKNGLCFNALHDKAFDQGYLTIDANYKIRLSPRLKTESSEANNIERYSIVYEGQQILKPKKFWPNPEFLAYHRENIFIA